MSQRRNEDWRLKAHSHFFQESLTGQEVQVWQVESEVDEPFVLILLNQGNRSLNVRGISISVCLWDLLLLFGSQKSPSCCSVAHWHVLVLLWCLDCLRL